MILMRRLLLPALLAVTLSGAATGCAAFSDEDTAGLQLTAAFYPLAWVTEQVSGRDVALLTTPGAEPHDLELDVRETAVVAQSDLVVYERGFQPAVDAAVDEVAEGVTVDAADAVELETGDDGVDPHFWLDPDRMADLGDAVADALVEVDPGHEEVYRDNAATLRQEMRRLETAYADGLSGCERDTIVVSHDAFGYLQRFGIELAPIAGLSPGAEPTPAHLAQLQELASEKGITTVFTETLGSSKMADTLASDLGLRTDVLDPIEGVAEGSDDDYLSIMRRNLEKLQEANGC
jgi:zinc transport system substrate-binding protein